MKRHLALIALTVAASCATVPTVEERALDAIGARVDLGGPVTGKSGRAGCGGPATEAVEDIVRRDCRHIPEGATIIEVSWSTTGVWQSVQVLWTV